MSGETRGVHITATGLRKTYGQFSLQVDELDVPPGSTLAIIGPSGSGKSTLLTVLALLVRADAGQVYYDGAPVDHRNRDARLKTAALFQQPYLFRGNVEENVAYGLRLRRVDARERKRRIDAVLKRVGLSGYGSRGVGMLSGGEAQRVALARALVLEPRVLFLDEPLSSLDTLIKTRLTGDFAEILHAEGITTVYVTHDQAEASTVSDRIAILREGKIVRIGGADEVISLPTDDWIAGFIGMEPPIEGRVVANVDGVAQVDCGEASLYVISELPVGTQVLAAVRPEDVLLFEADADIPLSSARNRLTARVVEVGMRATTVRVVVEHGCIRLAATVSRASAEELSLAPGVEVIVLFKATATRITAVS